MAEHTQVDSASPPPNNSPFAQPIAPPGPGSAQPATPDALQWSRMSAAERSEYDRSVSDQQTKGGTKFVHTRDAAGNPVIKDRVTGKPVQGEAPASAAPASTGDQPAPTVDGDKLKFGDLELSADEARELMVAKADADLRKAGLPASPAEYKAELPANFEMPAGVKFEINESDPLLIDARNWVHAKGLDQGSFSELVGIYATAKAKETAQLNAAHAAEVAKMGVNGTQRVTALEQWLRGVVGDKLAGPMRTMMVTADIVKGLETLQQKFSSQGAASFSQAHRAPADPAGRVNEATYNAMSHAERLNYARQFPQDQFQRAG